MPTIDDLRLRRGEVVDETFFDNLADILESSIIKGAVDMYGYMHKDIIPDADLKYRLGTDNRRLKEVHVNDGFFSNSLSVQGKPVLKDGDPVYIADLYSQARASISEAVKNALKPFLLAKEIEKDVTAMSDVFATDVAISEDGRLRIQLTVNIEAYSYLKKTPAGEASAIISMLNEGKVIPAKSWFEQDVTVMKNDYVNVQFYPDARVSVLLFNISSA